MSAPTVSYPELLSQASGGALDVVEPFTNRQLPDQSIVAWPGLAAGLQKLWQTSSSKPSGAPTQRPAAAGRAAADPAQYSGAPEQGLAIICGETPNPRDPERYIGRCSLRRDVPASSAGDRLGRRAVLHVARPHSRDVQGAVEQADRTPDPRHREHHRSRTPLANAVRMAHQLARARLLRVDGYGHTEFLNPSACAHRAIVAYVIGGELPSAGTLCRQDKTPFS